MVFKADSVFIPTNILMESLTNLFNQILHGPFRSIDWPICTLYWPSSESSVYLVCNTLSIHLHNVHIESFVVHHCLPCLQSPCLWKSISACLSIHGWMSSTNIRLIQKMHLCFHINAYRHEQTKIAIHEEDKEEVPKLVNTLCWCKHVVP